MRIGRYENPYRSVEFLDDPPRGATVEVLGLESEDAAFSHGLLWLPPGGRPSSVVALMHPRADFLRHYSVPGLLRAGFAVMTQNSRWVGNDSMLIHERVLLDVAAGIRALRERAFEHVIVVGNSGGGSLYSFYVAEAHAPAGQRLTETAAGDRLDLNRHEMPRVDGIGYLAAHPGEGHFLLHAIDPSVVDESDPVGSDPTIDMYDPANGFRPPPEPSSFAPEFLARYRAAQKARVERIDARARELVAERRTARMRVREHPENASAARAAVAVRFLTVYRTEADPRYVDARLDPSARDYGSLFGSRPDVINYGPFGFGRILTPEAWLSTWSGLSSRASIQRNGPRIEVPACIVSYTADNCVFPPDTQLIYDSLKTRDKVSHHVSADHYGHPVAGGAPRSDAVGILIDWMKAHGW